MNINQPHPWQAPNPRLGEMIASSMKRAFTVALILSILAPVHAIFMRLFRPDAARSFTEVIPQAGFIFVVAWILLFAFFLIGSSRAWSDRLFTIAGFLATFFGLGILVIFFLQLLGQVGLWFHHTPEFVQTQNATHEKKLQQLLKVQETQRERLAKSQTERAEELKKAADDEERKELNAIFDQVDAGIKEDLAKTEPELKEIAERSLRIDTSSMGLVQHFLTSSPSDKPQDAGIAPALLGSIWLGLITILLAVPVGVGAALYLEEYRQEGWLAKIIQININNLAGVPSVVFGILGGFVFVFMFKQLNREFGLDIAPRNLLGGGLTLGLLTLPMVIVSAQEAIRAVPISLRQGAYALGATKWQVMWTIVLPMARPGILTGTILALSRAIGEAAPLVLFGALTFVDQSPSLLSRFTALPLQIYNWSSRPPVLVNTPDGEVSVDIWKFDAAVGIIVLLIILLGMNAIAIVVRNRAQKKMRY